ncbi:optic atrophy 3 protein-domain-containing protein [Phyllosticta citrichinensis]|uniref:Optic atrophy 3 protein-domain-containing protein n=1 Tax=Phyllosticta citrichinensis TaxID=1130410 RepID=A0ABR1XRU1_9PEZI
MSLSLKIGSLFIRTLAKPIANTIKRNARDHEAFRRRCVQLAQGLHRLDVRWRVGLLQDPVVIEKQIQRELKEAEAKRRAAQGPTVKTEAEAKADEEALKKTKEQLLKEKSSRPVKVRPLSEAKAIDMGATFISETFMFLVAGAVIVFEQWRSRKKASGRRDEVDDKLEELQSKNQELKDEILALKIQIASVLPSNGAEENKGPAAESISWAAKTEKEQPAASDASESKTRAEPKSADSKDAGSAQKP